MNAAFELREPEERERGPHWVSVAAFPVVVMVFFTNQLLLWYSVYQGWTPISILLVLTASHLMHGLLIGFHEASHGLLRQSRTLNDIDGILLGVFSFMSFSLYQAAHQSHHAHLATEKDVELWPFVVPGMPRWKRIVAAVTELNLGLLFTPFLFFRAFLMPNSPVRSAKVRRKVWSELILMAGVWVFLLGGVAFFGLWKYFFWIYLLPAFLAGNLQSWRKYIEHVGMTGDTVNSATRSIIANNLPGRFISFSLLHEPYHGVHHHHSGLPHAELPAHAAELQPHTSRELAPFPSYRHALLHLLRNLPDPRVGAQWLDQAAQ